MARRTGGSTADRTPVGDAGTDRTALAAEYAGAVLALVRRIPPARAMTYGLVAEIVAETLHRGGPRQVGQVLAGSSGVDDDGAPVPWWRVVNAAGPQLGERRVDLRHAVWFPEDDTPDR